MHQPGGASRVVSTNGGNSPSEGCFPLHLACKRLYGSRNLNVVKVLFDAHPGAILLRDNNGNTPIDHAREDELMWGDPEREHALRIARENVELVNIMNFSWCKRASNAKAVCVEFVCP